MLLNYKKYGENGTPVFILHGIFGMLDNWHNIAKELSLNHVVYTIDARNHGQSPHCDEMSFQLMAEDLITLANSLNISQFILVGHSMGGKTAMWAAHQFENHLLKLIVVDIAPKTYKAGHLPYFEALKSINWSELETRKDIDEALQKYESNMAVRLFLAKNIERNADGKFELKCNIKAIENAYQEVVSGLAFNHEMNLESLFISGANSNYLLEEDKENILNYFPNAQFKIVSNAGHWVHAENSKEFLAKLSAFID